MLPACSEAESAGTRTSTFRLTKSIVRIMCQPVSLTYSLVCVGSMAQWPAELNVLWHEKSACLP